MPNPRAGTEDNPGLKGVADYLRFLTASPLLASPPLLNPRSSQASMEASSLLLISASLSVFLPHFITYPWHLSPCFKAGWEAKRQGLLTGRCSADGRPPAWCTSREPAPFSAGSPSELVHFQAWQRAHESEGFTCV